ncbi:unnamed protein product [Vitrella brassicaformis CCMP3155]|uniref:Uncharacterized protein n=1 Tax=Vitrella brassicaformis (strain CCMP3155) TaxID=1169540 RepID=A0A0G4FBW1_VITBC|nr:unnamed protein product [Vitrella brassicaformis CCMP3155]|eukprot:CEM10724.1 unnamed protein product [Vitrella brassicaformis CCMP3155]
MSFFSVFVRPLCEDVRALVLFNTAAARSSKWEQQRAMGHWNSPIGVADCVLRRRTIWLRKGWRYHRPRHCSSSKTTHTWDDEFRLGPPDPAQAHELLTRLHTRLDGYIKMCECMILGEIKKIEGKLAMILYGPCPETVRMCVRNIEELIDEMPKLFEFANTCDAAQRYLSAAFNHIKGIAASGQDLSLSSLPNQNAPLDQLPFQADCNSIIYTPGAFETWMKSMLYTIRTHAKQRVYAMSNPLPRARWLSIRLPASPHLSGQNHVLDSKKVAAMSGEEANTRKAHDDHWENNDELILSTDSDDESLQGDEEEEAYKNGGRKGLNELRAAREHAAAKKAREEEERLRAWSKAEKEDEQRRMRQMLDRWKYDQQLGKRKPPHLSEAAREAEAKANKRLRRG